MSYAPVTFMKAVRTPGRTADVLNMIIPDLPTKGYDMHAVITAVVDDGVFLEVQEHFAQLSPSTYLSQIHAHVYLMHDVDDPFIPFTQSRELVARAPPGLVTRYTQFSIFAHVIPEKPVPWQTFLPDLWRLFWHVHAVLLELL